MSFDSPWTRLLFASALAIPIQGACSSARSSASSPANGGVSGALTSAGTSGSTSGSGGSVTKAGSGGTDFGGAASGGPGASGSTGNAGAANGGMTENGGSPAGPEGILQSAPTAAADYATYNPFIYFKIVSKPSGRVLSVSGSMTENGGEAVIRDDASQDDQLWSIQDSIQGFKRFINKRSGRALSTNHDGGAASGDAVHLWQYLGHASDQDWSIAPGATGTVKIINSVRTGAALSLAQAGSENETPARIADDTATPEEGWVIVPVQTFDPKLSYRIINRNSNTALSVYKGGTTNNDPVDIYAVVNQPDQDWKVVDVGGGYYHLVNGKSGRLLSLTTGATSNGTVAMIYDNVNASDQGWAIRPQPSGFYHLENQRRPTGVLSIVGARSGDESQAQIYDDIGARDQSWSLVAEENSVTVNALTTRAVLSQWLTGAGIEDVNHEVYGGIYSQMIFGEAFQEPAQDVGVSGMWRALQTGTALGSFALESSGPFAGTQSQKVTFASGSGAVGIENRGLNRWGLGFSAGKVYDGYVYARSASPVTLQIAAQSATGMSYASTTVTVNDPKWKRYDFSLTPSTSDRTGRITLTLGAPGTVSLGYVFFEPGSWGRYHDLPVRKDIADGLVAQRNTVLRYGGSAILVGGYRWKDMVGPRELRTPLNGFWYPHASNGFGIFEFASFAEASGMLGIPTLNIDESPKNMADFVDYVNGAVTTTWGARRAADGHPAPYGIHRIELGNEQLIDPTFAAKFNALAAAIWLEDPAMILTIGDMSYHHVIADPDHVTGSESGLTTLGPYKTILDFAAAHGGRLAIDLHTWTDTPEQVATEVDAISSFDFWVHRYNPAVSYELDIFELNANHHDVSRALGNARAIGLLEQHGGRVKVVTSANALQADGQNDNGWDQGLVFYDTQRSWLQPPAYVTQMIAGNPLPRVVEAASSNPELTVTAKTDGSTLLLEVVNASDMPETPTIHLVGYTPTSSTLTVTSLSGNRGDSNDAAKVDLIRPKSATAPLNRSGNDFSYSFAANSLTLLRLQ